MKIAAKEKTIKAEALAFRIGPAEFISSLSFKRMLEGLSRAKKVMFLVNSNEKRLRNLIYCFKTWEKTAAGEDLKWYAMSKEGFQKGYQGYCIYLDLE